MSVPTKRITLQRAREERLNVIKRITAVFKQSCSGTVPSQSWDGFSEMVREATAAKLPHLCRLFDWLAPAIHRGPRQSDDSMADRFQSLPALS
jgi:hypothetical protein